MKTIKLMEDGIKPVFVFEGKPPEMKQGEVGFLFYDVNVARKEKSIQRKG